MPDIIYDIYVWINVVSFGLTILDKIFCGGLEILFWLGTMCFGGMGSTVGCLLAHHRTRNGDLAAVIFFFALQFGILYVLERIF